MPRRSFLLSRGAVIPDEARNLLALLSLLFVNLPPDCFAFLYFLYCPLREINGKTGKVNN
jgi:hypothetical protein